MCPYCIHCGKEISNEAAFCSSCGKKTGKKRKYIVQCPYCDTDISSPFKDKNCPLCGNFVYARYDEEGKMRLMLKEENLPAFEARDQELSIIWEGERTFGSYGIVKEKIEKSYMIAKASSSAPVSYEDVIWNLAIECAEKYVRDANFQNLSNLYYSMALFTDWRGENAYEYLIRSADCQLEAFRRDGVDKIRIAAICDCPRCAKDKDKRLSLEKAIEKKPLPHKNCQETMNWENRFCSCQYRRYIDL